MLHSTTIGGSSARRKLNCPASHNIAKTLPPAPSSSYADEGTMLHGVMETILEDPLEGATEEATLELSADLVPEMIDPALEAVWALDLDEYITEAMVRLDESMFGTVDVLGWDKTHVHIIDFKFGRGVEVQVVNDGTPNEQLLYYGAAAYRTQTHLFEGRDYAMLHIIQPPFGPIKSVEVSVADLVAFGTLMDWAVLQIELPDAPAKAGDWCKFCPAQPACPVLHQMVTASIDAGEIRGAVAEDMGRWMELADKVEPWVKEVRKVAQEQLEAGYSVPGWKLVPKRASRKWIDESAAMDALRALKSKIRLKDISTPKINGIVAVEKFLKREGLEIPGELFAKTSSGTTLAREDDERPAALTGVAALEELSSMMEIKK